MARYHDCGVPISRRAKRGGSSRACITSRRGHPALAFQFAVRSRTVGLLIGDVAIRTVEPTLARPSLVHARSQPIKVRGMRRRRFGPSCSTRSAKLATHRVLSRTDARNLRAQRLLERLRSGGTASFASAHGSGCMGHGPSLRPARVRARTPPNKRLQLTAAGGGVRRPWPAAVGSGVGPPPASGRC